MYMLTQPLDECASENVHHTCTVLHQGTVLTITVTRYRPMSSPGASHSPPNYILCLWNSWMHQRIFTITLYQLVFESLVQSGFWPLRPKTGTGTGPTKFECSKRPDWTHVGPDQCKTTVQTGHRTSLDQSFIMKILYTLYY